MKNQLFMLYLFNCFAIHIILTISWKAFANLRLFTEECLEEHVVLAKIEKPAPPKVPKTQRLSLTWSAASMHTAAPVLHKA